jgi:hypothetical protein
MYLNAACLQIWPLFFTQLFKNIQYKQVVYKNLFSKAFYIG